MRLVCPKCSAEYDVDAALIPEEGREVQCASCQNIWFQEKAALPPPLVLNPTMRPAPEPAPVPQPTPPPRRSNPFESLASGDDDDLDGQVPPSAPPAQQRPSDVVPPEERQLLRDVAQEEVALNREAEGDQSSTPPETTVPFGFAKERSQPAPETPAPPPEDEEELLRSLREQLAIGEKEEPVSKGPTPTGRRSVVEAAANAGITGVTATAENTSGQTARMKAGRPDLMSRYFEANDDDDILYPKKRGRGGLGLFTALALGLIALGVYRFEPEIATRVPDAAPYLEQYVAAVDNARVSVEGLYQTAVEKISEMSASTSAS